MPSAADRSSPAAARGAALILAAHGERQVASPNRLLAGHARALSERLSPMPVACGVLNGEPSLESALEAVAGKGAGRLLVYPLFMADGYFVEQVLPKRIAESGARLEPLILSPLGLDPGLEALMLAEALAAAKGRGFAPEKTRLLVAGHGSKFGPASADATRRMANRLAGANRFARVGAAFLEEPPFIADALKEDEGPVVVSGFFAGDGMHSSRDVPEAIARARGPAVYTGPVGAHEAVRDIVAAAVARAPIEKQN